MLVGDALWTPEPRAGKGGTLDVVTSLFIDLARW